MYITRLLYLIVCLPIVASAQQSVTCNFEDASLNKWEQYPQNRWGTDSVYSLSEHYSLWHNYNNSEAGTDIISYRHDLLMFDSATVNWHFRLRYNYKPSSANNWAVWLSGAKNAKFMNAASATDGYVLGVNFTGSDDLLKVYRVGQGKAEVIAVDTFNWQENIEQTDIVSFNVIREIGGNWQVFIDSNFSSPVLSFQDKVLKTSEYFGVYYQYSATQDQKLWFDDLYINGLFYADTIPPGVDSCRPVSKNSLMIFFSESVDTVGACYTINNIPISYLHWKSDREVLIGSSSEFELNNTLNIEALFDSRGNKANLVSANFTYYQPYYLDIVISEIMADPTPVVELPEVEYIELYNRSAYALNLKNWQLKIGNKRVVLSDFIVSSGEYVILCDADYVADFKYFGSVCGVDKMPALNNSEALIWLIDSTGKTIHAVEYNNTWHDLAFKKDGGWSLEMIDMDMACVNYLNWSSTLSASGGTPGKENTTRSAEHSSVQGLYELNVSDSNEFTLSFNMPLDSMAAINPNLYHLNGELLEPDMLSLRPPLFKKLVVSLNEPLENNLDYTFELTGIFKNCAGEYYLEESLDFRVPKSPMPGSLVINEVLFNAGESTVEFIEIVNSSQEYIELKNCRLGISDNSSSAEMEYILISYENTQLAPGKYLVLMDGDVVPFLAGYNFCDARIIYSDAWKLLNNTEGNILILNPDQQELESIIYKNNWHFPLLDETKGVSLERISFEADGWQPDSWHSAAITSNYATPGCPNSQMQTPGNHKNMIALSSETLSPDNDGMDDILTIQYNFPSNGYVLTLSIYNKAGERVKVLKNNLLCGTSENIVWNGLDENGHKLPMGYYIILSEYFNLSGLVEKDKRVVLLLPEK